MTEQFDEKSEKMISALQGSLRSIRQSLGIGVQELSNLIGVTRQTINNLETKKGQMSVTQFVAVCSVIDHYTEKKPQLKKIVYQFLQLGDSSNDVFSDFDETADVPLLNRWFALFTDDSSEKKSKIFSENFSTGWSNLFAEEECNFKYLAENCRVFLDDTILLDPLFEKNAEPLFVSLEKNYGKFIIPMRAVDAVNQKSKDGYKDSKIGVDLLRQLNKRKISEYRGETTDGNVTETLVSVFAKFKQRYRLALFTQSSGLASSILELNTAAREGADILVYRLEHNGKFISWNTRLTEKEELDTSGSEKLFEERKYNNGADETKGSTPEFGGWDTV